MVPINKQEIQLLSAQQSSDTVDGTGRIRRAVVEANALAGPGEMLELHTTSHKEVDTDHQGDGWQGLAEE